MTEILEDDPAVASRPPDDASAAGRRRRFGPLPNPREAAAGSAPVLVLWAPMLLWYVALRPGVMTNDSMDIWTQVLTGDWVDWHPPAYTALNYLSRWVFGTPALTVLSQTLALAWALSRVLRIGIRMGLPAVPVWVGGALLCLTPPVGAFSVHLWKDVPYTAGFLLVAALFATLALHRIGLHPTPTTGAYVAAGFGVVTLDLLRPNGIIVVLLSGAAVLVLSHRRLLVAGIWVIALVAVIAVQSVLNPLAGVREAGDLQQAGLAPFDLGYLAVNHPDEMEPRDLELVEQLAPLEEWRRDFDCHWAAAPMDRLAPAERVARLRDRLQAAWRRALLSNPVEASLGHLCAASVAWNPIPSESERRHFETLYHGVIPNQVGMESTPVSQWLTDNARQAIIRTSTPGWQPWFWRAPTWIYLGAVLLVVAAVRARSFWPVLAISPLVAQQLSVIAMTGPHARYMLPAGIAAFALLPAFGLAAVRAGRSGPDDAGNEDAGDGDADEGDGDDGDATDPPATTDPPAAADLDQPDGLSVEPSS